ncbi:hypothetical protein FS749_000326 [Ceratobasidium sp. UAMH 11750]|nr:hypothetical protein FS749_000326 [Ceratobasidium sp. UAMH 11750]
MIADHSVYPPSAEHAAANYQAMSTTSITDYIRGLLPDEATRLDDPPFYCSYSGSIQGIWKNTKCIPLILGAPGGHCGCTVYSWKEAIYTMASGQSFKDILFGSRGWDRLHGVLLELFGGEELFVLGPQLIDTLQKVPNPPPSLTKFLRRLSESPWLMLRQQPIARSRRSTLQPSQKTFTERWGLETNSLSWVFIDKEVIERMYLIDWAIRDSPLVEDIEMCEGVPVSLSSRRAKLLNLTPDDFFYDDYVDLVNQTTSLEDEESVDDLYLL